MAKSKPSRKRRDWRRTLFLIISVLIILSMALGLALSFAPPPAAP
jgi:nitrate reductase NapE component